MFYYIADYLQRCCDVPGAGVFQYISFRTAAAVIVSLLISLVFGTRWISYLNKKQVGETIRDLGLEGQLAKQGTPTMGGLIILASVLIPTLLFAKLDNIYILLMIFTTVWLGFVGFLDDYIKVFKKNKKGLSGKYKILAQVILGLVIGATMYFSDSVVLREKLPHNSPTIEQQQVSGSNLSSKFSSEGIKSTKTTIPFVKNNEFDYAVLT